MPRKYLAPAVYLSCHDVARIFGVRPPRVHQMVKAGQLRPAIRVANSYGFHAEEVEEVRQARERLRVRHQQQ